MPAYAYDIQYNDPTNCLLSALRKQAAEVRMKELIGSIKEMTSNDPAASIWRRDYWMEWEYLNKQKDSVRPNGLSDDAIARARNFPIDKIIKFKNGVAESWCHADRSPSLTHWKDKNLAHCFPCGKTFDPIDAIMEMQGVSFTVAVKMLS